jgi:hypothetical protein
VFKELIEREKKKEEKKEKERMSVPFVSCFVILNYAGSTAFVASPQLG